MDIWVVVFNAIGTWVIEGIYLIPSHWCCDLYCMNLDLLAWKCINFAGLPFKNLAKEGTKNASWHLQACISSVFCASYDLLRLNWTIQEVIYYTVLFDSWSRSRFAWKHKFWWTIIWIWATKGQKTPVATYRWVS